MGSRVEVLREGGRVEVSLRGERRLGAAAFLALWLGGWAFGEWTVARRLFLGASGDAEPDAPAALVFVALWLALWTVGGVLAALAFLRSLGGSEAVAVEGGEVTLRRRPFGRRRVFPLPEVRALRVEPSTRPAGMLAFDAGGRAVRFGAGLSPEEAGTAFRALATRLPSGHSQLPPEPPEPPEPQDHGG